MMYTRRRQGTFLPITVGVIGLGLVVILAAMPLLAVPLGEFLAGSPLLAGRIATQLRLRKQAGGDELQGTLAEINAALQQPDVKDLFEKQSLRLIGGTPERLAALMQSETTRWNRVVKDAGIKPE